VVEHPRYRAPAPPVAKKDRRPASAKPAPCPTCPASNPSPAFIGPVHEYTGPVLWNEDTRDQIAPLFGSTDTSSWRVGHRDIDVNDQPHTVLMVNLVSRGPLTYCGPIQYQRHEGEKPMRVWFDLDTPLRKGLWGLWR